MINTKKLNLIKTLDKKATLCYIGINKSNYIREL